MQLDGSSNRIPILTATRYRWLSAVAIFIATSLSVCLAPNAVAQANETANPKPENNKVSVNYSEDRAANFVFLVDVSGSMVLPRTMVPAAGGGQITLFEALRAALKQIARDNRILSPNSKVSFITFGTQINEKSTWPSSLKQSEEREALLEKIASVEELQADKHGDTYMAGALDEAYKKALKFTEESSTCTTTFILMLTDGWDEPPKGAPLKIETTASKIVEKEKELKEKLGVNTWQVRVIGLQRLPDKKAGTTTAAEVAQILGGQFLDVTKAKGGTVAEQIYQSLKKTIEELKGQIDLPASDSAGGIVNFGRISTSPRAFGTLNVTNKSCYVEKVTGVKDVSAKLSGSEALKFRQSAIQACASQLHDVPGGASSLISVSKLPAGAIKILLHGAPEFLLAPLNRTEPHLVDSSSTYNKVDLEATIGPSCPPGSYLGAMEFTSTAKIPGKVPYVITIPSRYFVEPETTTNTIRKQGFFLNQPVTTEIGFEIGARVNSSYSMDFKFQIEPEKAYKIKKSGEKGVEFPATLINEGKVFTTSVNSASQNATRVKLPVNIPANAEPGIYEGEVKINCKSDTVVAGPSSLKYRLTIQPSPWDEMSPIAIPSSIILLLVLALGAFMAIAGNRERI